jgi:hypothetical protein
MGLTVIPNQPINLNPYVRDACNEGDLKEYCTMYESTDDLYLQWIITSCGDDLNCDPTFAGGENIITNGTFTNGLTGWNPDPSITWDNVNGKMAFGTSSGSQFVWYYFPAGTLVSGNSYSVTFTVSNRTAGSIRANVGGGTNGTFRSTNATFTETIVSGSDNYIRFEATSTFDGDIDDVAIVLNSSGCMTVGANWTYTANGLQHTAGATTASEIALTFVENTGYQQIIVTLTDVTAGALYVYVNGTTLLTMLDGSSGMTKNGTYYFYSEEVASYDLHFVPSTDFDGTISEAHVYELHRDYSLVVTDSGDGSLIYDATGDITYTGDRATAKVSAGDIGEGCVKFNVVDPCLDLTAGVGAVEISPDVSFADAGTWAVTDGGTSTGQISGGRFELTTSATAAHNYANAIATMSNIPNDGIYIFKFTVITGVMPSGSDAVNNISFYIASGNIDYIITNPQPSTTYTYYVIANYLSVMGTDMQAAFSLINTSDAGEVNRIESFSVQYADISTVTSLYGYTSNCIDISDSHSCAKLVEAYKENIGNSLGFYFPDTTGTAFKLTQRNRFLKFNPYYPIDSDDNRYSNGERKYTYAEREKYYECKFDYMDETAHDTLSTEIVMDKFIIDSQQYFVKAEDYRPIWAKEEGQNLAQARLEIRKTDGTIYNNK